jgi:hypothetical protein
MLTDNQIIEHIGRVTPIGLGIVLITNIFCFAAGSLLAKNQTLSPTANLIIIILGLMALADIGAAFIVKKKLLQPLFEPRAFDDANIINMTMMKTTVILSAICAAPPLYGLVVVLLGGKTEYLAGFMITSLVGYQVLRLRPRDFKQLTDS